MNIFDLAAGRDWALADADLLAIMTIAAREGEGPAAVALRLGRPLDNSRNVELHDGVAVVPLDGPMFRRANMLTEISGATSTEQFGQDFQAALDNPQVKAVVLDISSPGGEVAGVNEVAAAIFAARGAKPIVAYVGDRAASGAYWIASAADRVVLDATAQVGSIGAVARWIKTGDRPGISSGEIVSTQSPRKRLDPETEAGRADIQREIDAIAQVFIEAVARHRGIDAADVLEHFGQGGVEIGAAAVSRGMADALGSLDSVIADLNRNSLPGPARSIARRQLMPNPNEMTAAQLAEAHPAAANALREEGAAAARTAAETAQPALLTTVRRDAAAAERTRILEIQEAALPGYEALARSAIDGGTSPAEFALAQAKAQKAAGTAHLAALRDDEKTVAKLTAPPAPPVEPAVDPALPVEQRAKAEWDKSPELRGEFGDRFNSYLAFKQAEEAGKVRRLAKGA
jgi:signal peptide peptidase SppA